MSKKQYFLEMRGINKKFPGVQALTDVSLNVKKGEILGLVGANGAGKSTLMNILGGLISRDSGDIYIEEEKVNIKNPFDTRKLGIAFIHQELKLFHKLSIAENILIKDLPTKGSLKLIDTDELTRNTKKWLEIMELRENPSTKVEKLSLSERQLVEIARELATRAKLLILDEPTSSLASKEIKKLFQILRDLKKQDVSIIFISHKLEEIFEICNRITVLRNGKNVGILEVKDSDKKDLVNLIIGKQIDNLFPELLDFRKDEDILKVKNITSRNCNNISFAVKKREILGIFGLVGAGRTELARAIFGLDAIDSGSIEIENHIIKHPQPRKSIRNGLAFLTENRRDEGLILEMSVKQNICLTILSRIIRFLGWINEKEEKRIALNLIDKLNIATPSSNQKAKFLSGGNQQKLVMAKWLVTEGKLLILDEPTRGIDVGSKAEIHKMISNLVRDGLSVIYISSEPEEVLAISHRILVIKNKKIVRIFDRNEVTYNSLISSAMGGT